MQLILLDSISAIDASHADAFVVTGSHGGVSAGQFVLSCPVYPMAVAFNDAGIGKDGAGIAALAMLQNAGILAFAYSHLSARIGEAGDAWLHGSVSQVNAFANPKGITAGMSVQAAYERCGGQS